VNVAAQDSAPAAKLASGARGQPTESIPGSTRRSRNSCWRGSSPTRPCAPNWPALQQAGVAEVFGPGTVIPEAANRLLDLLQR